MNVLLKDSRMRDWHDITLEEVYGYIGIRIYMGLHPEHDKKDYWTTQPNRPFHFELQSVMSRKEYEAIHRRIRVSEGDDYCSVFERVSIYKVFPEQSTYLRHS